MGGKEIYPDGRFFHGALQLLSDCIADCTLYILTFENELSELERNTVERIPLPGPLM